MSSFNAIPRLIRFGLLLVVLAVLAGPALGKKDKLPEGVPGVTVGAVGEKPKPAGQEDKSLLYVKRVIGSSDDEWPVLRPRVERVLALLREANAGRDLRPPKATDPKAGDLPAPPAAPNETSDVADRSRE